MDVADAIVHVLATADEPLHWTVIQDRALRAGYIDPFEIGDVRSEVLATLRVLVDEGGVERVEKGVYQIGGPVGEQPKVPAQP